MEQPKQPHKPRQPLVKLTLALNKALDASMAVCTKEKMASAFPGLTRDHPQCLDEPRDQIVDYLKSNCKEEFENVLNRRGIPEKLQALDSLKTLDEAENDTMKDNRYEGPL
jgi:hypothetical protein